MSDIINKVKKDEVEYEVRDLRIPAPTIEDAGKALGVDENGHLAYIEASSPVPVKEPPVKGDRIMIDGHVYLVLEANEWVCKLLLQDIIASDWYRNSPSSDQKVTFMVEGVETLGMKYDGSNLDIALNTTFLESLASEVQEAIIEQEVLQDMYNISASEGDETYIITGGTFGSTYRIKKMNDESVSAGTKKIFNLSCKDVFDYYGTTSITQNEFNALCFGYNSQMSSYKWFRDASFQSSIGAPNADGSGGGINSNAYYFSAFMLPAFVIDLENINFGK